MQKHPTARRSGKPERISAVRFVRERIPIRLAPCSAWRSSRGGSDEECVVTSVNQAASNTSRALEWIFSNKTIRVMELSKTKIKTTRSEERRVGKEGVSTCKSRCWRYN